MSAQRLELAAGDVRAVVLPASGGGAVSSSHPSRPSAATRVRHAVSVS